MSKYLSGKKVLFIAPIFHNYHTSIISKLEDAGAEVVFCPERKYGAAFKFINNFYPQKLKRYQARHYEEILEKSAGISIDYLLVVRGFMMPATFMAQFRAQHPGAKAIMYQWDSNKTNPFIHLIPSFDRCFSFDFEDCENAAQLEYVPLFYTDDVKLAAARPKETLVYDFFFMGWYFPERYAAVINFRKYAESRGWKLKAFLYIPFTTYVKERLKGIKPDRSIVSFRQMSRQEYLSTLCTSRVMVDVSNPNQTGLAMRIIEAFACGVKVLTNNRRLMNDKIYVTSNVCFFDDKSPVIEDETFLSTPVTRAAAVLSIDEWLSKMFAAVNNAN
ncbi:hypothetical protein ECE50_023290 [Chitinophaga sp. Mgbs1]|uniref:Uncharacterized protein n=1 Tax=Chitinophaga solisilvae TaxID=1233460 RepID=A0A433WDL4_9BACT|nr:hypothetical protein [Chitinophaga solisilvae]